MKPYFQWKKLGLIFDNKNLPSWASHSALTPTPIQLNEDIIRVYAGFRDSEGVSRIGFVDLDADHPHKIIKVSKKPALDIGRNGCFDDNGVILGDVCHRDGQFFMYYVGFQLVKKAKFLAFTGLAISEDGESFVRYSETPIMDRINGGGALIRAIHSIRKEKEGWRAWYAMGESWQTIHDKQYPKYDIWTIESKNGIDFFGKGTQCITCEGEEYRIGRPSVYQIENQYIMLYTKGSIDGQDYFPGIALSSDGIHWQRTDDRLGIQLGPQDYDSQHLCYPRLLKSNQKYYAFYNGNHMGHEGFAMAELTLC